MSGAAPPPAQGAPAGSEAESSGSARDLLLAAASAVMREGDLVDISLSELSLRSGLNSALVKYYFGNKAGLLTALVDEKVVQKLWDYLEDNPGGQIAVDLEAQTVATADGSVTDSFDIDEYTKWRLLNGFDDISLTLRHEGDIAAFEGTRPGWKPATLHAS